MYRICLLILMSIAMIAGVNAQEDSGEPANCANMLETGLIEQTLISGEIEREYLLYLPAAFDGTRRLPVVVSLHGFASNPRQQMEWSGFNTLAEDHDFIAVYPAGTGFPARWHAGISGFQTEEKTIDDVFFSNLLDHLINTTCADPARIYVTGFSNGGGMTHRIACQMADRVAAIGTVAGAYATLPEACQPAQPVPVITFHGTGDGVVPYDGGALDLPDITTWVQAWAQRNGCANQPATLPKIGAVSGINYENCDDGASVVFYTIDGGGHSWPGSEIGLMRLVLGEPSHDIDASATMWTFFSGFHR